MPITKEGFWVPDLQPRQMEVFNCYSKYLLVEGPKFSGKCVDGNTVVPCDGRLVRMESLCRDLESGEQREAHHFVSGLDDSEQRLAVAHASHVYRDPYSEGMSIVTKSGYEIKCSAWHPVYSYASGRFAYRTSSELKSLGDLGIPVWVAINRGYGHWSEAEEQFLTFPSVNKSVIRWSKSHDVIAACIAEHGVSKEKDILRLTGISYSTTRSFFKKRKQIVQHLLRLSQDVAYLLGLLVGDGCMTDRTLEANRIGLATTELASAVKEILDRHFPDHSFKFNSRCDWYISSDRLKSLVLHLGLNQYAHEKAIPNVILESPRHVLKAFIQGLFDTDGSALKSGHVEYCSASEALAKDVHQILLAFGVKSSIRFKPNKCKGSWNLTITTDAPIFYQEIGFRLERKQDGLSRCKRHFIGTRTNYPSDIKPILKSLYLSRHDRGAVRGNVPRSNRHSGFTHTYSNGGVSVETLSKFIGFTCCHDNEQVNKFFIQGKVFWETIKSVTPCPVELYDFVVPGTHNFVGAGFINHNTVAVCHKVARHLWETNGAEASMMAKIIKTAKNAGTYQLLTEIVIPEWMENGYFGGKYIKNSCDGVTKTPYIVVKNMHGTESKLSLFSCEVDAEVEQRTKNTEFSLIWFIELSNFKNRIVFDATKTQLRGFKWKYEECQWIGDTNPAEEGEESWIWKLWFKEKFLPIENSDQKVFRDQLESIHFEIADNQMLDPRVIADLRASYEYNPDLWARYILGKWTASTTNSHFSDLFVPNLHVAGNAFGPEEDWEVITPTENCIELITGWDMGDVNHAAVIAQKRVANNKASFDFIDELVFLKEQISIGDFTVAMLEKMDAWEDYMLREYGTKEIGWRHWSDNSVFTYRSAADSEDELIVRNTSDGRIKLMGAPKGKGHVKLRVNLIRKLLFDKRVFWSAHLFQSLRMMKGLKKGRTAVDWVDPVDPLKHVFDATSYLLIAESPMDAEQRSAPKVERKSTLVTVGV